MGTFVENVNILANGITAGLIDDIAIVVDNSASVIINADNIVSINTNATNIASINSIATDIVPNLAEILLVDDKASAVTVMHDNVVSLYDQFDDRYLGSKATDPTLDNDGNAIVDGALYWNTTDNRIMVYDLGNTIWVPALSISVSSTDVLTNKTLDSITNQIGANHIHHECRNVSGSTIPNGTVVTAQGIQSGTDYVEIIPVTDPQTQIAIGITHTSINNNNTGLVINTGVSDEYINTNSWAVGTILYPNTSGGLTQTKPTSGQYQACAIVLRQHATQGRLLVEFTEPKKIGSTTQAGYVQLDAAPTNGSTNAVSSDGVFDALALKAPLASPTFTGVPIAPTAGVTTNTTQIATTAFVNTEIANDAVLKAGSTMTGAITALRETKVAMGANNIDLTAGNLFTKTISGATTLTVSGWLATGNANSFILELTNGGSAVVTYFAGVKWASGTAPTLTAAGVDVLGFYSHDGGTTVRGIVLSKDSK